MPKGWKVFIVLIFLRAKKNKVAGLTAYNIKKPSLCFLALAAWPILSRDRMVKTVGGAEVQISLLARAFAAAGHRVTMICMDYGQSDNIEIDGVRVIKAHSPAGGIPVLRFIYPRFMSIWKAMESANADIYYQRGAGVHTSFAAAFCDRYDRLFLFAAACDADFDPELPLIRFKRDRYLFSWGLKRARAIVVQNPHQQERLTELYERESTLIRSCYTPAEGAKRDNSGYVLWVSTMRKLKQPHLFIELARQLPQHRFRIVGGSAGDAYYSELQKLAKLIHNLDFVGFVPYADIEKEFDGARVFVNTSRLEGFPNTFLQAWARGIPCVSYVKTGSSYKGESVLVNVGDLDAMVGVVNQLMNDDEMYYEFSSLATACYIEQHSVAAVLVDYKKIFYELMSNVC